MPPLVVPSAALIRLVWASGGTPYAVNVIGARKTVGLIDQAVADQVATAVRSALTTSGLVAQIHTTVSLSQVGIRDISTPSNPEFIGAGTAVAGTGTGKKLPPQVSACITLRTARAGKSFRGRFYTPGFSDVALAADGSIVSAASTAAATFVVLVRDGIAGLGLGLAIVSRKLLSTELVGTIQSRDAVWDTIRGRATAGI